jgi:ubiquinone/menaquinone biosynthesis C-methylase UbiE
MDGDRKALAQMRRVVKPAGAVIITVPFGRAKIIRPDCRVYDFAWLTRIEAGFTLSKEAYYLQDDAGDWYECSRAEAGSLDARNDLYAICCHKLIKA